VRRSPRALLIAAALPAACLACVPAVSATAPAFRIARVIDGDTVVLTNGAHVRLVQIDTPEVGQPECSGRAASATTRRLLPPGTAVQLLAEPATDRVDRYGRLLRYVVRARDGLDVNIRLVALGAAAPYFYRGRRGRYAARLEALARRARRLRLGLWGACPNTPYRPDEQVDTGRAGR
jgi:endonuclease YncB( thermonuclease family)